MMKTGFMLIAVLLLTYTVRAQQIQVLQEGKPSSIRGLFVLDDKVAWASGSSGYVAKTTDGGATWAWLQVKGYEKADFRDIEVFSDKIAVIIASGTPALILKTINGGQTWQQVFKNDDPAYFLDAMGFSDAKHGWVLGDPVNGKFLLLETTNGGQTWQNRTDIAPPAQPGEAAFAASGTCLRIDKKRLTVVTGGSVANLIRSADAGAHWKVSPLAIAKGKDSKGGFSVAQYKSNTVVTGGNYSSDTVTDSVACYAIKGLSWQLPTAMPGGYQSCVEHINGKVFLSTGTPGSNITVDNGAAWKQIDITSFNVCSKAKHGKLVLLAGNKGKIAVLKFYPPVN
jgi:photosystem II stability/assembly factor-like uncharacterized protein